MRFMMSAEATSAFSMTMYDEYSVYFFASQCKFTTDSEPVNPLAYPSYKAAMLFLHWYHNSPVKSTL